MLTRTQHWATRAYHEFLRARAAMPFAWGSHDCALFAADGVECITGTDIAAPFRGKYSDEAGAFAAIAEICGGKTVGDAAAWCCEQHGIAELKNPLFAQRGDLVVLNESGRLIAGLVHLSGAHIVVAGESGLKRLPITDAVRAWHV